MDRGRATPVRRLEPASSGCRGQGHPEEPREGGPACWRPIAWRVPAEQRAVSAVGGRLPGDGCCGRASEWPGGAPPASPRGGLLVIRVEDGRCRGHRGHRGPPPRGPVAPAVAARPGPDLAYLPGHRAPAPWPVGLVRHPPPHRRGRRGSPSPPHVGGMTGESAREVSGAGGNTCHQTGPAPGHTDTHGTAPPTPREALAPSVGHHGALRAPEAAVSSRGPTRACAHVTRMRLRGRAGRAILLVPERSTVWAGRSDAQGCGRSAGGRGCWCPTGAQPTGASRPCGARPCDAPGHRR
jgi:hypothetical protein